MRKRLFIEPHGLNWKVHWESQEEGRQFAVMDEAVRYARRLVGGIGPGACTEISVRKPDGSSRTEWSYGKDPFPPDGQR